MELADQKCVPCRGGVPKMGAEEARRLGAQIPQWAIVDNHHLARTFNFTDFKTGLDFVNRIGAIAEAEGHHPDILLRWGNVVVTIWTHKIDGLTESDFVLAAKAERAYSGAAGAQA